MRMEWKFSVQDLMVELQTKGSHIRRSIQEGMQRGIRFFEGRMIRNYMSGRKGGIGLNRQTGNLARSWFIKIRDLANDFSILWATRTPYARIHQYGGRIEQSLGGSARSGGSSVRIITIPKRMMILEDFITIGRDLIMQNAVRSVNKEIRLRFQK